MKTVEKVKYVSTKVEKSVEGTNVYTFILDIEMYFEIKEDPRPYIVAGERNEVPPVKIPCFKQEINHIYGGDLGE